TSLLAQTRRNSKKRSTLADADATGAPEQPSHGHGELARAGAARANAARAIPAGANPGRIDLTAASERVARASGPALSPWDRAARPLRRYRWHARADAGGSQLCRAILEPSGVTWRGRHLRWGERQRRRGSPRG